MKGFEDLYGASIHQEEHRSSKVVADDLTTLAIETANEDIVLPNYLKAVIILANKVASLDASVSMLKHRDPFAPLNGVFASMEGAIEQLTASCMDLFEFATANNVLEILDPDFNNPQDNEEI